MREIKTLVIVNDYSYVNGGASQIAILTANLMCTRGLKVYFFTAVERASAKDLDEEVILISTNQNDILNSASRWQAAMQGIWNRKAASLFNDLLRDLDPETTVIHIHGWIKALSGLIAVPASRNGFKMVCTLHDYFIACPNGGFYNYPQESVCQLKPMSFECIKCNCDARNYGQKAWRVIRQFVQNFLIQFDRKVKNVIAVSDFSLRVLSPYLDKGVKTFLISNPGGFTKRNLRGENFKKRAICIGRISKEKGIELACMASERYGFELLVIGEGELRVVLESKYPKVIFSGWRNNEEIGKELRDSSVFLFPSLWYETQGLSVLEALSAGVPAIVSDVTAASEFVNGENGVLFRSGDVDDLGKKVLRFINNERYSIASGQAAGAAYWENPFTIEKYENNLLMCYNNLD